MLAHALLSLLVFEHDFIQVRFGIFECFCFCFLSNKYLLIQSNFTRYFSVNTIFYWWETYRSSHPQVFCEKGVLGNFTKFIGKHLCQSLFFNKVACLRPQACNFIKKQALAQVFFSVNFVKFLSTPFLTEHLWWLLLHIRSQCWILK